MKQRLEHRFYQKSKKQQIAIQITIALVSLIIILLSILISWNTKYYFIGILSIAIVLSIIAPFFDTPSLKKSGNLIYYAPLLLAEKARNGILKIHGGTLFDYIFVLDYKMNGKQRTAFIIQQYIQGLLNIIQEFEDGKISDLKVKGTSYIINERTAQKIGFKITKTDNLQKLILVYNYINIMISSSIAKARFSLPNLGKIRTFESDLAVLTNKKESLNKLNNKLKNTIAKTL